jgi:nicotinamide riboside kinase
MAPVIALLGAPCTGKTQLSQEMAQHLQAQGIPSQVVPEALRLWCDQHQRAPLPHEQLGIANAQTQAIAAARAKSPKSQLVVADTTALMTAVYSELYFGDTSLYSYAFAQQRQYSTTLLMGMDLPWQSGDWQRGEPQQGERADTLLRQALLREQIPFVSVYGQGEQRLQAALNSVQNAINSIAARAENTPAIGQLDSKNSTLDPAKAWVWVCDKCSDPDCEHRLFAGLASNT